MGRLYGWFTRFLPRDVREAFGPQMSETFEALLIERRSRQGAVAALRYGLVALLDLVLTGMGERIRRRLGDDPDPREVEIAVRTRLRGGEGSMFTDLRSDILFALRTLRSAPGVAVVLTLTLGLGIGANTAIFSVLHGVLLQPLPYANPGELAVVWHVGGSEAQRTRRGMSGLDLLDYRTETERFVGFAGASALGTNLTGDGQAEKVVLSWTTPNFFDILGVEAAIGRTLVEDDLVVTDRDVITRPGYVPPPVPVVLSHGLWQRRFGEDPTVIGRSLELNGQAMDVIGVMPPGFRLYLGPDALMPTNIDAWTLMPVALTDFGRGGTNFTVLTRLAPGVGMETGQEELERIAESFRELYPSHAEARTEVDLAPLHAEVVGDVSASLWVLFGAVGLVLLIACANVASLLLVRSGAREQEFAVRAALGGGHFRIVRQLLTESLTIAALGTVVGLFIARWGIELLLALRPENLPRLEGITLNGTVLAFTIAVTGVSAVLFGLAPAVKAATVVGSASLANRGSVSSGRSRVRLLSGMVIGEVALSVVLLIGAGLLLRSFVLLQQVQPGFDAEGVVTASVSLPFFEFSDEAKRANFYDELHRRVSELPGIESAAVTSWLPLAGEGDGWVSGYLTEGEDPVQWANNLADFRPVTTGYFQTMRTPLVKGRVFGSLDNRADGEAVALVDTRFAERVFPTTEPVGQRLMVAVPSANQLSETSWVTVVGVVEHIRYDDITSDGRGTVYLPLRMNPWFEASVVMRTGQSAGNSGQAVRAVIASLAPSVPVFDVRPLQGYVDDALAPARFSMTLMGIFALVAMVLASVGLYGVVSTSVQQRTREIGLRMALGAEAPGIYRLIVTHGLGLSVAGVILGIGVATVLSKAMASLLFGVAPTDLLTFGVTAVALVTVAGIACYVPARRASRVDPVVALRAD